jgi:hypothetical protein
MKHLSFLVCVASFLTHSDLSYCSMEDDDLPILEHSSGASAYGSMNSPSVPRPSAAGHSGNYIEKDGHSGNYIEKDGYSGNYIKEDDFPSDNENNNHFFTDEAFSLTDQTMQSPYLFQNLGDKNQVQEGSGAEISSSKGLCKRRPELQGRKAPELFLHISNFGTSLEGELALYASGLIYENPDYPKKGQVTEDSQNLSEKFLSLKGAAQHKKNQIKISSALALQNIKFIVEQPFTSDSLPKIKKEIKLSTIEKEIRDHKKFKKSLTRSPYVWDDVEKEMRDLDQGFLELCMGKKSNIARGASFLGGIFGLAVSQANIPIAVVSLGRTFDWPIAGWEIYCIGGLIMTTTPVYVHQLGNWFGQMVEFFENKDPLKKKKFEHTKSHKALKVLALLSSVVPTAVKVSYLFALEGQTDIVYAGITCGPLAIAEIVRRYSCASATTDMALYKIYAGSRMNLLKRDILQKGLRLFSKKIKDPKFARQIYKKIESLLKHQNTLPEDTESQLMQSKKYLGISALFLVPSVRNYELNLPYDIESLGGGSRTSSVLSTISDIITGAAIYTTAQVTGFALDKFIFSKWFGASPAVEWASQSIALASATARTYLELDSRRNWLKGLTDTFSLNHLINFKKTRKAFSFLGLTNAAVHAFTEVEIGSQAFASSSILSKILLLSSIGVVDAIYYDAWFNEHFNDIITQLAMLKSENLSDDQIRNVLNYLAVNLGKELPKLDTETIENLYEVIFNRKNNYG